MTFLVPWQLLTAWSHSFLMNSIMITLMFWMFTMSSTYSCQCRSTSCLHPQPTVAAPPTVKSLLCQTAEQNWLLIGSVNVQNNSKEEIKLLLEMWHEKMESNSLLSMLHDKKKIEFSTLACVSLDWNHFQSYGATENARAVWQNRENGFSMLNSKLKSLPGSMNSFPG